MFLIVVGTIDVLPHYISSVYAFFDQDICCHDIHFGQLTALYYKIDLVKHIQCHDGANLKHYVDDLGHHIKIPVKK